VDARDKRGHDDSAQFHPTITASVTRISRCSIRAAPAERKSAAFYVAAAAPVPLSRGAFESIRCRPPATQCFQRKKQCMPISEKLKALIRSAWDDGAPCLVATQGPNGPNISPKGSMVVFDDGHLAYWERSKKQALENLDHDKRVCVIYANFKAQRDGVLDSGFLRFYGIADLHESGPVRDAIFNLLLPREQTHVGADTGIGVLVKIERAADVRGKPLP
jgi:uncharacterized protein